VYGNRAALSGLNIIGLKRHDFSRQEVQSLRSAYRLLFAPEGTFAERLEDVAARYGDQPRVMEIIGFIRSASARGLCQPRHNGGRAD
jgi:UDP-N-acetylglucosamine acyltransferase